MIARLMVALLLLALVSGRAGADAPPATGAPPAAGANEAKCNGKFPNPVTDICWSCLMPLTIGSATVANIDGQEDIPNPALALCSCVVNPVVGIAIGFWEPARLIEVVRKPFCLPTLGGVSLDPGIAAPHGGTRGKQPGGQSSGAFYQAHFYMNTVLALLQVVVDFPCLEQAQIDLAYITEVDPTWNDDELSAILNPEAVLFANPIAQAACIADCVAASTGIGLQSLFWCAGCQGSLYPYNGHVPGSLGGVRSAELLSQRMLAKLHRELLVWGHHGQRGLCGPYFLPQMDKTAYKLQLIYPVAANNKIAVKKKDKEGGGGASPGSPTPPPGPEPLPGPAPGTGPGDEPKPGEITAYRLNCCHPLGRSTILWGMGKEIPVKGEDFGFLVFRKRNCCVGY